MNWKNLKLGAKLGLGFGLLILISMILGGIAVYNMSNISTQSDHLASEYIPEVNVASNIERNARETMYNMRGYSLSEQDKYLGEANRYMQALEDQIASAHNLVNESTQLDKLREQVGNVESSVEQYKELVEETVAVNRELASERNQMDASAETFLEGCYNYLKSQDGQIESEISSGASARALRERHDKITWINDIIDAGNAIRVANFKAQAQRDPESFRQALNAFDISQLLNKISAVTYLEADKEALDKIETAANNYTQAMNLFIDGWERRNELNEKRDQTGEDVLASTTTVAQAGINNTSNIANEAVQLLSLSSNVMIYGLLLALILGVILAVAITRNITTPLYRGIAFAREVADGNLDAEVNVDSKDEIGDLAHALRRMVEKLKDIVSEIRSGADNIAAASQQMSSSSQEMSQGSSEQASSAEEVSSSMEEMSANIQQNADNAQETEKISTESTKSIQKGNEAAQNSVSSMREIAEKISIINDIAFQTNILALNAAVEAARAGEHGKGFAVVASEVRKLAERSAEAANEIDAKSKSGVEISEQAGKQLEDVVPEIEKTSRLVQEITASSNEMSNGADQVNSAIQQLNQVTQQNAAASEELATSAEELSSQADQLRNIIGFFRLEKNGAHHATNKANPQKTRYQNTRADKAKNQQAQSPKQATPQPEPLSSRTGNGGKNGNSADAESGFNLKMYNGENDQNFERY